MILIFLLYSNIVPTGGVSHEQRNLDTAATEFQRRFHISVDAPESRQRTSGTSQVSQLIEVFH